MVVSLTNITEAQQIIEGRGARAGSYGPTYIPTLQYVRAENKERIALSCCI
jgi:hypothetical protein